MVLLQDTLGGRFLRSVHVHAGYPSPEICKYESCAGVGGKGEARNGHTTSDAAPRSCRGQYRTNSQWEPLTGNHGPRTRASNDVLEREQANMANANLG